MIKAILYKEWIKTRWMALFTAIVLPALTLWACLRIGKGFELQGAAHIWHAMLTHDTVLIELIRYAPLFAGILFAVAQFVPEMQQKRLKLTLHLPVSQQTLVALMLIYGLSFLTLLFAVDFLLMVLYLQHLFPAELTARILLTALPWHAAGLAAYGLAGWICLEPTWRRRLPNGLLALALLRVCFLSDKPEAYNDSLVWLLPLSFLVAGFAFLSVKRFKEGRQD